MGADILMSTGNTLSLSSVGIWHQQATETGGEALLHPHWDTRRRCNTGQRNVNEACRLPACIWKHKRADATNPPCGHAVQLCSFYDVQMIKCEEIQAWFEFFCSFPAFLSCSTSPHIVLRHVSWKQMKVVFLCPLSFAFLCLFWTLSPMSRWHTIPRHDAVNSIFSICFTCSAAGRSGSALVRTTEAELKNLKKKTH